MLLVLRLLLAALAAKPLSCTTTADTDQQLLWYATAVIYTLINSKQVSKSANQLPTQRAKRSSKEVEQEVEQKHFSNLSALNTGCIKTLYGMSMTVSVL